MGSGDTAAVKKTTPSPPALRRDDTPPQDGNSGAQDIGLIKL